MQLLEPGTKAPDFTLPDAYGKDVSLKEFSGSKMILWFFPKAMTSGWIKEGSGFRDEFQVFTAAGIKIVGVSADPPARQLKFSDKYEFQLVNDNCHALGAIYENDFGYASKYADAVNLSFHPVKHITTGEGGAVLTNNIELDERIKILRTHGITKDEKYLEKNDGPWYYEMHQLGYNYRITDFQSALGISQLNKLYEFVTKRREIAKHYDNVFSNEEKFIIPEVNDNVEHAYHLYPLQIKFEELEISRNEYFEKLKERNILLQVHYIPIHLQPFYRKNFGFKEGDFPVAEKFYQREVSIPIYPLLEDKDLEYIAENLKEFAK